eukprot:9076709-Pyramimonas_sp.AAC.1
MSPRRAWNNDARLGQAKPRHMHSQDPAKVQVADQPQGAKPPAAPSASQLGLGRALDLLVFNSPIF